VNYSRPRAATQECWGVDARASASDGTSLAPRTIFEISVANKRRCSTRHAVNEGTVTTATLTKAEMSLPSEDVARRQRGAVQTPAAAT